MIDVKVPQQRQPALFVVALWFVYSSLNQWRGCWTQHLWNCETPVSWWESSITLTLVCAKEVFNWKLWEMALECLIIKCWKLIQNSEDKQQQHQQHYSWWNRAALNHVFLINSHEKHTWTFFWFLHEQSSTTSALKEEERGGEWGEGREGEERRGG